MTRKGAAGLVCWTGVFAILWFMFYRSMTGGTCGMGPVGGMCDAWNRNAWRPLLFIGLAIYAGSAWWLVRRGRR